MERFVVLLLLIVLGGCFSPQKTWKKTLSFIPLEDREKLDILFHHLLTGDYFACTLFGNKPLTTQEFQEDPWKLPAKSMFNPHYFFYLEEGWKTWEKYRSFFSSDRFIFTLLRCKANYQLIILINKPAFEQVFQQNLDIFQRALGVDVTIQQIFHDFEKRQKTFEQILNGHEGLIGIVFGYGRENSLLAYRSAALQSELLKNNLHPLTPPAQRKSLSKKLQACLNVLENRLVRKGIKWHELSEFRDLSFNGQDFCEELNKIQAQSELFRQATDDLPFYLESPNFLCIKDSFETKNLKESYAQAMKMAQQKCRGHSFFTVFLEQYCQ